MMYKSFSNNVEAEKYVHDLILSQKFIMKSFRISISKSGWKNGEIYWTVELKEIHDCC